MTIRLGQSVRLNRDTKVGEVIGLRRLGGSLYALVSWTPDRSWTMSAPVGKLIEA